MAQLRMVLSYKGDTEEIEIVRKSDDYIGGPKTPPTEMAAEFAIAIVDAFTRVATRPAAVEE